MLCDDQRFDIQIEDFFITISMSRRSHHSFIVVIDTLYAKQIAVFNICQIIMSHYENILILETLCTTGIVI